MRCAEGVDDDVGDLLPGIRFGEQAQRGCDVAGTGEADPRSAPGIGDLAVGGHLGQVGSPEAVDLTASGRGGSDERVRATGNAASTESAPPA